MHIKFPSPSVEHLRECCSQDVDSQGITLCSSNKFGDTWCLSTRFILVCTLSRSDHSTMDGGVTATHRCSDHLRKLMRLSSRDKTFTRTVVSYTAVTADHARMATHFLKYVKNCRSLTYSFCRTQRILPAEASAPAIPSAQQGCKGIGSSHIFIGRCGSGSLTGNTRASRRKMPTRVRIEGLMQIGRLQMALQTSHRR